MTPEEAQNFFADNQIKFILAQFVDIHGSAKGKAVPIEHLKMVLNDGAGFAGFALWGFGMGPHGPDYMAVGELDTLKPIPWMPGFACMSTYGKVAGQPYAYDSRTALKRQLDQLAAKGLTLYTGIEPEFMLLRRAADGSVAPADSSDTLEKPCYDYKGLARNAEFLSRLVESVKPLGLDVYQIDHEDGNGQYEVNFTYSDALTTADRFILFKMAASEIAHKMGMIATFMPKPFPNRTGTGAHFHVSIGDRKTPNLFLDEKDPRGLGLSKIAYQFLAGLMLHAPALTAVCAPTVNSYKRLVVGRALSGATWAPAYVSYGDNNRTCCIRVPYGHLEVRLADGSCNPYLATIAILAAGLDGIAKELDPGEPNNTNLYEATPEELKRAGIRVLPQNLNEALDALEADSVLSQALGEALTAEFVRLKRMEWVEYQRHVSAWEVEHYLEFF
jgi:glutamine synthetase